MGVASLPSSNGDRCGRNTGGRALAVSLLVLLFVGPVESRACTGDCDAGGSVGIDELTRAVRVALSNVPLSACQAVDADGNAEVTVDELVAAVGASIAGCLLGGDPRDVLYSPHTNQLDVYELSASRRAVLIPAERFTVNGQACALPDGSGNFVVGDDTGQPEVRPGWGIFSPDGRRLKKLPLPERAGEKQVADPIGCAFDPAGRLFTTAIGAQGGRDGQLIVFFPPLYDDACILDDAVGTPGTIAIDPQGDVYVPESAPPGGVFRYSGPFPASVVECASVAPSREVFIDYDVPVAPLGIARASDGHWYVSSVIGTATIHEHDETGAVLRELFEPGSGGSPAGVAVDSEGSVYYADLGLDGITPRPNGGSVRRVRFDAEGRPRRPDVVRSGLSFPDAVAVLPRPPEHSTFGGSLERLFYNPNERIITRESASDLIPKWRYRMGAIITSQPAVAWVSLPDEGPTRVVYATSWDGNVYALRLRNGSQVWQFAAKPHPGATYPHTSSPAVDWIGDRRVVLVGGGMTMYCLDAATGEPVWQFDAGTGCTTCDVRTERNQIESSPAVHEGFVYFGMDVNDAAPGKGGLYALHLEDGRLAWYLDIETDSTCRPLPGDDVRRFDGFHSAAELGLPDDFFTTRPGCDFDRTSTACGNLWSSPAIDRARGLLYIASSNCDTDDDPESPPPPPPMPPYDRALFAVALDGTPAWVWRPTEVDNQDLSFGGAPNLFAIEVGSERRDVVGVGNKNGTYYVVDRDGVNELNGVTAADPPEVRNPMLPYWSRNVVAGGSLGGIIVSTAVVPPEKKVIFGTAPGEDVFDPQRPTMHALNADDGSIAWQRGIEIEEGIPPTFSPTVATPGLAYVGTLVSALVSIYDSDDGAIVAQLETQAAPIGAAAAPTIVGGMLLVGGGIGELGRPRDCSVDPFNEYCTSLFDVPLSAFCVRGTLGCEQAPACNDSNPCTYDYREDGECRSENAPNTIDCRMAGQTGRCSDGVCILP